jgi:hypothetical protein
MFSEYQPYKCWNIGNSPENKFSLSFDLNREQHISLVRNAGNKSTWQDATTLNDYDDREHWGCPNLQMGRRYVP